MRSRAARITRFVFSVSLFLPILVFGSGVNAQSDDDRAAHAIAEKFSGAAEERAKAEAARKAAEAKRKADALKREAERRKAEEADMLARAKAEAEERQKAEAEARAAAEAARLAAEKAAAELKAKEEAKAKELADQKIEEERQKQMTAEREAELVRLSEKLRRKYEAAKDAAKETATAIAAPPTAAVAADPDVDQPPREPHGSDIALDTNAPPETRVTVLLALKPSMRGLRRLDSTADPVLCLGEDCYVSSGPDDEAVVMARVSALGIGSPLKSKAGPCHGKLGCIFRDVDLKDERATLEPVDLHFWKHDRREEVDTSADKSCRVTGGRLICDYPIDTPSWQAWVVPESIANEAGPAALEAAIRFGLTTGASAQLENDRDL